MHFYVTSIFKILFLFLTINTRLTTFITAKLNNIIVQTFLYKYRVTTHKYSTFLRSLDINLWILSNCFYRIINNALNMTYFIIITKMCRLTHFQRGGADVPLFETRIKTCMILVQIIVTALKFGIAVGFVKNNMELWRHGGGTAATAENRRRPPKFFFAISRRIRQF